MWKCGVARFEERDCIYAARDSVFPYFSYSVWDGVKTPELEYDDMTATDAILEYANDVGIPWEEIEYAVEFDDGSWAMWKFAPGPEGDFHIVAWSNKSRAMEGV